MKSFFKRSAIGLAVLSVTGSVYAMGMGGYFVGVEALRLRPMNGDLDIYRTEHSGGNKEYWNQKALSSDFNWDWRIFGGMNFGDNDDVTVSWFRMHTSDSEDANLHGYNEYHGRWGVDGDMKSAKNKVELDNVYGVMGHTVHFNNPWSVRFAGGLEYAHLENDLSVRGHYGNNNNVMFQSNDVEHTTSFSDLKGWGPRAEFDATYRLPSNFALFANTSATLLVSTRDVELQDYYAGGSNESYDYHNFSKRHVVVPKFGMRLGASYSYMFGQAGSEGAGSCLVFSAGWQAESYVHGVERPDWNYNEDSEDANTKTSNFGDHGLFLGVTFKS